MKLQMSEVSMNLPILAVQLVLSRSEAYALIGKDKFIPPDGHLPKLSTYEKELLDKVKPSLAQSMKQTLQLSLIVEEDE
jgi:hypothetical protein